MRRRRAVSASVESVSSPAIMGVPLLSIGNCTHAAGAIFGISMGRRSCAAGVPAKRSMERSRHDTHSWWQDSEGCDSIVRIGRRRSKI